MPYTLAEVEEALEHARAVPADQRGPAWHSYVDSLLEKRVHFAGVDAAHRETRVMFSAEAR